VFHSTNILHLRWIADSRVWRPGLHAMAFKVFIF